MLTLKSSKRISAHWLDGPLNGKSFNISKCVVIHTGLKKKTFTFALLGSDALDFIQ